MWDSNVLEPVGVAMDNGGGRAFGWTRNQRWGLVALVLLSSVACDRVTKQLAETSLAHAGRISLARDTVRVELVENSGAFLSLGANLPKQARRALLVGGVAAIVLGVLSAALFGR